MKKIIVFIALLFLVFPSVSKGGDIEALEHLQQGNPQLAFEELKPAAENGNANAQYSLGLFYKKGLVVPQDYKEAIKWFRRAADQGDANAQEELGFIYNKGLGVPQNITESINWYSKAAAQGHRVAQFNLGSLYHIQGDYKEAIKWYRKAADQGDANAQNNMGDMYRQGNGVPQDYQEAKKWYRKAAEQGNDAGQFNLGLMFYLGLGGVKDYVQAYKLFNFAASQGIVEAFKYKEMVTKKMTPAQIDKALKTTNDDFTTSHKASKKLIGYESDANSTNEIVGALEECAFKYIDINIMSAVVTKDKQPFLQGWSMSFNTLTSDNKNSLSANKKWKKPPKGNAFGIIKVKITNNSDNEIYLNFSDIILKADSIQRIYFAALGDTFEATNNMQIGIKSKMSATDTLLFDCPENGFNNVTIQVGNCTPRIIKFKNNKITKK